MPTKDARLHEERKQRKVNCKENRVCSFFYDKGFETKGMNFVGEITYAREKWRCGPVVNLF